MVRKALNHAESSRVRIYIQHCGRSHLFGSKNKDFSYQGSLSAIFGEHNAECLPVFIKAGSDHPEAWQNIEEHKGESLIIENMADCGEQVLQPGFERGFIKQILSESGNAQAYWNVPRAISAVRRQLRQDVPRWLEQTPD